MHIPTAIERLLNALPYFCLPLLLTQQTEAVILYSGDNSTNLTTPDAARSDAFNSIARVCNNAGGGSFGSAIHIQGKYLLTANHVSNQSHVTFDGNNLWARDTSFTPRRIGTADMKLIKLVEDPKLPSIPLNTSSIADIGATATLIGWGVGRDPNVADSSAGPNNTWSWGDSNTMTKRWGTNVIEGIIPENTFPTNFTYQAITTTLDIRDGDNEAAAAIYDSGSGLFILTGGVWKLAGLTTSVTQKNDNASTFALFNADQNYFVRISPLASAIQDEIPDLATYSGWKVDHSLYANNALDNADTDDDGIGQLLEFALGGDPRLSDISILPTHALVEDGGSTYLQLTVTRPIGLTGITYTPKTTTDLISWPNNSTGIEDSTPAPQNNGDGTETLIYRRSQAVSQADAAFIRIDISETS